MCLDYNESCVQSFLPLIPRLITDLGEVEVDWKCAVLVQLDVLGESGDLEPLAGFNHLLGIDKTAVHRRRQSGGVIR